MVETSIKENVNCDAGSQPKCQILNVKLSGQGLAKGLIHLIDFASNCHRDFKLGS